MTELRIAFRRPVSLPPAELSRWLAAQARAFAALSGRLAAEPSTNKPGATDQSLLQLSLPAGTGRTADDRTTELLSDMRMLGLDPHIVGSDNAANYTPATPKKG